MLLSKNEEEEEGREEREKGREGKRERRDGEMWRLKPLLHAEKVDSATAMESAWRRLKTIKTEAHDSTVSK